MSKVIIQIFEVNNLYKASFCMRPINWIYPQTHRTLRWNFEKPVNSPLKTQICRFSHIRIIYIALKCEPLWLEMIFHIHSHVSFTYRSFRPFQVDVTWSYSGGSQHIWALFRWTFLGLIRGVVSTFEPFFKWTLLGLIPGVVSTFEHFLSTTWPDKFGQVFLVKVTCSVHTMYTE